MFWVLGSYELLSIWGFPKIRGTLLGVPTIRTIVFLGLYWGPPILGNYHMGIRVQELWLSPINGEAWN